jgi:hypothetical protein
MTVRLFALTCGYLSANLGYLMEGGDGQVKLPIPLISDRASERDSGVRHRDASGLRA